MKKIRLDSLFKIHNGLALLITVGFLAGLIRFQNFIKPKMSGEASLPADSVDSGDVLGAYEVNYLVPADNKLITNEYAYYHPYDTTAAHSADWRMTSGSLFSKDAAFWTGVPSSCIPNKYSSNCTNSNVFRLRSSASYWRNTKVSFAIRQNKEIHNSQCSVNDTCWYGAHAWLRYQTQYNLY